MTQLDGSASDCRSQRLVVVLVVFVIAFCARAGFGLYASRHGAGTLTFDDERWYWALGESYARGDGFVGEFGHRAERMPLYPWFLSLFAGMARGMSWARGVQWGLGSLAAVFSYLLALDVFRGLRFDATTGGGTSSDVVGGGGHCWALVAGLLVACDPALVGSASLLLTETLHATVLVALWWVAWPLRTDDGDTLWRWGGVGVLGALAVYLREASLVFIGLLLLYLLVSRRGRRTTRGGLAVTAMVMVALLPWGFRNARTIGAWYWLTTRGGISLYDGVRSGATGAGDLQGVKDSPEVVGLSEVEWDRHFQRASKRAMWNDPGRIIGLMPRKLARTWSPVLHAAEYGSSVIRLIFAGWYLPLYALSLVGLVVLRRSRGAGWYLFLPVLGVSVLHCVFVGSVRYRVPALPMLAVLASVGGAWVAWLIGGWRVRRRSVVRES